jgi:hypothetical protein
MKNKFANSKKYKIKLVPLNYAISELTLISHCIFAAKQECVEKC